MPWVKRPVPGLAGEFDSAGNSIDPDLQFFYEWVDEDEIPAGDIPIGRNASGPVTPSPEGFSYENMDEIFGPQQSMLRTPAPDPVEEALRSKTEDLPLPEIIDQLSRVGGKQPEQRMKLPTFTEEFPLPQRQIRDALVKSEAVEETKPYYDPQEPITDVAAAPFHRAYQAATGRMTEAQQRDFLVNTVLGLAGGGPIGAPIGAFIGAAQASDNPPTTPEALIPFHRNQPVESIGGLTNISPAEWTMLGVAGAATIGMAFGPGAIKRMSSTALAKSLKKRMAAAPRPVRNAAPGTMDITTPIDIARNYDDVNAGVLRMLRRMGMDPRIIERIERTFRIQTRATTNGLTDAAVSIGRMETPAFTFHVNVPLSELKKLETPHFQDYMHVLDTIDDIKLAGLPNQVINNPQAGNPVIRGLNQAQADSIRRNLETAHPELPQLAKVYNSNLRAMRNFEVTGEYATVPIRDGAKVPVNKQRSRSFLNKYRPNEVPWPTHERVTGNPVERGSPIDALSTVMRERLRARMENEAVGMYVDEVRRIMPELFVRVTAKQIKANKNWEQNVVKFKRRGRTEYYTTSPLLADTLRMDPYYMTSGYESIAFATKRWMEITTTGELAPWFAVTSFLRSWQISKLTAEANRKSATLAGSLYAIPQQLYPQMARYFHEKLDGPIGGWFSQVFGPAAVRSMSLRMAHHYDRSLYAMLEAGGGGRGSIMQQQTQLNSRLSKPRALQQQMAIANSKLDKAIRGASGSARTMLEGYRNLLNAVHNAPAFNYASRNRAGGTFNKIYSARNRALRRIPGASRFVSEPQSPGSMVELAAEARHVTGDPRIGGQFYSGSNKGSKAIRFENDQSRVSHTLGKVAKAYGVVTEVGRTSIPWFNATVQGVKRIGEAYMHDPVQFTQRLWLYQVMPAVSLYLWARSLGEDPNGVNYADHMMNRRSDYDSAMNFMVYVPGQPAEDGIRVPGFHEASPAVHLSQVMMDHAFRSNLFPMQDDFMRAAANVGGILMPAAPPIFGGALALGGLSAPQGPFSGNVYRPRTEAFDQNGGTPGAIERFARQMTPGVADIVGSGAAAYTGTPKGFLAGVQNFLHAAGERMVSKTPILRDIVGMRAPASGQTRVTENLFESNRELKKLEEYYRNWREDKDFKPKSQAGEVMALSHLGERPPTERIGIPQPPPTNPLYNLFMETLHKRLTSDQPWEGNPKAWEEKKGKGWRGEPAGGLGQQSLWQWYGKLSEQARDMRKINIGNMVTWRSRLSEEWVDYLERNQINPERPLEVRNFIERKRQEAARVILFNIKSVETEFSEYLGQPITLKNLDPYGKPVQGSIPSQPPPVIRPNNDY